MTHKYGDEEIIEMIGASEADRNNALKYLYEQYRGLIVNMVITNSGNEAEGLDVFQDSLIALYENLKSGKFKGESAISSYLYSISKFIWFNRLKKTGLEKKYVDSLPSVEPQEFPDHSFKIIEKEKMNLLQGIIEKTGTQCKKVLIYALYHEYSMKEISRLMGYKSEQIARNKKFKCSKKLKELIKSDRVIQQILSELK